MYVRRDPGLRAEQMRLVNSYIALWVRVNGVVMVNVYRRRGDRILVPILEETMTNTPIVVVGDFNVVYWTWMPGC